ncbi:MAG: glycosyl hydrolase family 18 protein [Coriobacteriia bacterium]
MFKKLTASGALSGRPIRTVLVAAGVVAVAVTLVLLTRGAATQPPAPALATVEPTATPPVAEGPALEAAGARTELVAFYANFDQEGFASLERNAEHIDVLMPMWFHLGSDGQLTFDSSQAARVGEIIAAKNPDMKVMPIVNNYDKAAEQWNAPAVSAMIADPTRRIGIAEHIVSTLSQAGYDGVNIDFENFTEADRGNLVAFMAELYPRAKAAGLEVSMDVIVMSRTYDHAALAQHVDYLVPMMYDEHWKTSPAGPISSIPWFQQALERFLQQVPAEKVTMGVGTYAYDWSGAGGRAKSLTYQKAVALAQQHGAAISLSDPTLNSSFSYSDGTAPHAVWMLDAMSAFNQVSIASKYGVRGYAIWRLGAEDPSLWDVLPKRDALDRAVAESLARDKRTVTYDEARSLITSGTTNP